MTRKRLFINPRSGRYECGTINKDGSLRVGQGDLDVTEDFASLVVDAYIRLVTDNQRQEEPQEVLTARDLVGMIAEHAGLKVAWSATEAIVGLEVTKNE